MRVFISRQSYHARADIDTDAARRFEGVQQLTAAATELQHTLVFSDQVAEIMGLLTVVMAIPLS